MNNTQELKAAREVIAEIKKYEIREFASWEDWEALRYVQAAIVAYDNAVNGMAGS